MTIKGLRANANLSQQQVADALNISLNTYRNKESGKNEFKLREIVTLANLFNVPIDIFRTTI